MSEFKVQDYLPLQAGDKMPEQSEITVWEMHSSDSEKAEQNLEKSSLNPVSVSNLKPMLPDKLREAVIADDFIATVVTVASTHNVSVAKPENRNNEVKHVFANVNQHELVVQGVSKPKPPPPPPKPDPVGPFYTDHCMCPEGGTACHMPYLGTYEGCMNWCKTYDGMPGGYLAFIPKGTYTVTYSISMRHCSCCGDTDPCKWRD
jgi:hypothetical protein